MLPSRSLAYVRPLTFALASCWVLATAALTTASVAAQSTIAVRTELRGMSEGSFNAFTATIEGATEKQAVSEYKALVKEYGGKAKRSRPESFRTEAVVVRSIGGSDPVDLFVSFDERGADVEVRLWVRQRGEFIGDASAQRDIKATEAMLEEFALRVRRAAVQAELDGELREMAKLEKRMSQVERDIARAERDIVQARAAIERAEANIARAEGEIVNGEAAVATTQEAMDAQSEAVEAVREKLNAVGREVAVEGS